MRENYSSGTKWESFVGYSRAVKIGSTIHVSGTTATNEEGELVGIGDPYLQTKQILQNIRKALNHFGAQMSDVMRTRIYVTDINQWEKIGKAHGEFFRDIAPASTMIEISRLVSPDMVVEIEAEAILD